MTGDFGGTSDPHKSAAPVVFEVGVYPFHGRAFLESGFFMGIQCAWVGTPARVGSDDGDVAEAARKRVNLWGVVSSITKIVEAELDECLACLHQGDGYLRIVEGSRAQDGANRDVEIRGGDVKFVAFPGFLTALAVGFAAYVAEVWQVGEVFFKRAKGL